MASILLAKLSIDPAAPRAALVAAASALLLSLFLGFSTMPRKSHPGKEITGGSMGKCVGRTPTQPRQREPNAQQGASAMRVRIVQRFAHSSRLLLLSLSLQGPAQQEEECALEEASKHAVRWGTEGRSTAAQQRRGREKRKLRNYSAATPSNLCASPSLLCPPLRWIASRFAAARTSLLQVHVSDSAIDGGAGRLQSVTDRHELDEFLCDALLKESEFEVQHSSMVILSSDVVTKPKADHNLWEYEAIPIPRRSETNTQQ